MENKASLINKASKLYIAGKEIQRKTEEAPV